MAKKKPTTSGTSHLLKDLNLSSEHQGIVDLVHNANKSLREGAVPKEHVSEVQKLVKEHVVHLHKVLPKETVTKIFTRLAPAESEPNAQLAAVTEKPKKGVVAAPKRETLGDIIDRNAAKLKKDPEYKPAVYPPKANIEEPAAALTDDKAAKRAAAKAHNEKAAALRAADKAPKPSEDLHPDITPETELKTKIKEKSSPDKSLAAQLKKAAAENKRLRAKAAKVLEPAPATRPAPPEAATGEIRLSFDNPPPPPAPVPAKTVVEEPPTVKVEPAEVSKAAKEPELAGVKKLTKVEAPITTEPAPAAKPVRAPKVSPIQKKVSSIFEELKASVASKPEGPKASKSREAIVEATKKLEAPPEKPPTIKSIFKGLKAGGGDPLAKLAISTEEENLKQASKADTTPELGTSKAKLRMDMDEAGRALRKAEIRDLGGQVPYDFGKQAKIHRPPLELPEVSKPSTPFGLDNKPWSRTQHPVAEAAVAESTPEWLRVAQKAATAADETAAASKAARAGETVSRMGKLASTTNKLGKLGIAGLAIYGGIEALKKIGKKLEE